MATSNIIVKKAPPLAFLLECSDNGLRESQHGGGALLNTEYSLPSYNLVVSALEKKELGTWTIWRANCCSDLAQNRIAWIWARGPGLRGAALASPQAILAS